MKRIDWKLVLIGALSLAGGATILKALGARNEPASSVDETVRIAERYDAWAEGYDPGIRVFDWLVVGNGRRWAGSQARGDVLEIAVGTGRNLPYYGNDVRLTGIDISPRMLEIARRRARESGRQADLRIADAQALEFPDASFDSVVSTLSMCTIPDERKAIAEARRVLRPGGRIILFEHVASPNRLVRAVQQLLDPLTMRLFCDHLLREPAHVAREEGFVIERLERSQLGIIERLVARKPA